MYIDCESIYSSFMLYSPPGAVNIASYKEPLNQSDCWKPFVQFWNYTKNQEHGNPEGQERMKGKRVSLMPKVIRLIFLVFLDHSGGRL